MQNPMLYKILKYLALASIVYLIFRFVLQKDESTINNIDVLIFTTVIVLVYILIENLFGVSGEGMCNNIQPDVSMCNNVCKMPSDTIDEFNGKETPVQAMQTSLKPPVKPEIQTPLKIQSPAPQPTQPIKQMIQPEVQQAKEKPSITFRDSDSVFTGRSDEERGIERGKMRSEVGTLNDESKYSDYNILPMAWQYKKSDFEYGDSFLPPEQWFPQPPFPPVCVTEKKCPVCPVYTVGTPVDVKEWNNSRRITQPDNINVDYVRDKLNSGR